jgi:magnesium transporter
MTARPNAPDEGFNVTRAATLPSPELLYLLSGDPAELSDVAYSVRSADVADVLSALPAARAADVVSALPLDVAVRVLDEPELVHRSELFAHLGSARAAMLIDRMAPDQQADLFRSLPDRERRRLVRALDSRTRASLEQLLEYPPDSAGGFMTTELIALPESWTVETAVAYMRRTASTKETVHPLFVLHAEHRRLLHVVSPWELLVADPTTLLSAVGRRRTPVTVGPFASRDEVARLVAKYDLIAIPVVDDRGRILGMVTIDDVMDALTAEQTEDMGKFGGGEALDRPYLHVGVLAMVRKRAPWLCALFLSEMLTATAMGHFEGEISRAVVLALFVPLIISSGGNSGSQATSLIIRAMALRELRLRDWWRVVARELPSGLLLGGILGVIGFGRIMLWQVLGLYDYGPHHVLVAATVASALVGVVLFGSFAGSMLPFILRRLGFDPASASAPFVATLVDVTGLVIYFGAAFAILRGTLL